MVDKKVIEQKLAELMDIIPECEGLIAADSNGEIIVGKTITDMDDDKIAKACVAIVNDSNALGNDTGKGGLKTITIELEDGFVVLVGSKENTLIALAGSDGRSSLALLKRNLISISNL
jgi:predicted regulator of Ras-like GTPase activity (Roadblock/LC7/MglB family)